VLYVIVTSIFESITQGLPFLKYGAFFSVLDPHEREPDPKL